MGLVSWVIQLVLNLGYLGSWACFAVGSVGQTWNFANRTGSSPNPVDTIDDILHNSDFYCTEGLWLRCCSNREQECALIFTDSDTLEANQIVMDVPTLMQHSFAAGSMLLAGLLPILALATLCCGNKLGAYILQATSGLFALVSLVTYLTYYISEKKVTPTHDGEIQSWDFHDYFPDSDFGWCFWVVLSGICFNMATSFIHCCFCSKEASNKVYTAASSSSESI